MSIDPALAIRHIGFFVYPGFQIQDLSGPLAAFELAELDAGIKAYRCHVVSQAGGEIASSGGLKVITDSIPSTLDTLLVVGGEISDDPAGLPAITGHLAAAEKTARGASEASAPARSYLPRLACSTVVAQPRTGSTRASCSACFRKPGCSQTASSRKTGISGRRLA
jgi:hypothetical protein